MPQGDGTGPAGMGPMTGRVMGFCAGFNSPGFMNSGFGRGRGFAFRARTMQPQVIEQPQIITEKQEKQYLEQELGTLKEEISEIEKRLKSLNSSKE